MEKREPELKKRQEALLKKYIETGMVTKEEIQEWEKQCLDAYKKSSERQSKRLAAKQTLPDGKQLWDEKVGQLNYSDRQKTLKRRLLSDQV